MLGAPESLNADNVLFAFLMREGMMLIRNPRVHAVVPNIYERHWASQATYTQWRVSSLCACVCYKGNEKADVST
jgi:hypothetical protein